MIHKRLKQKYLFNGHFCIGIIVFIFLISNLVGTERGIGYGFKSQNDLFKDLDSSESYIRELAAIRLGQLKLETALVPLIKTLMDREALVRIAAVNALGKIGNQRAIRAITPLLKSL